MPYTHTHANTTSSFLICSFSPRAQAAHASDDAFDLVEYCASTKAALRLPSALEEAFTLPATQHNNKSIAAKTILKKLAGTHVRWHGMDVCWRISCYETSVAVSAPNGCLLLCCMLSLTIKQAPLASQRFSTSSLLPSSQPSRKYLSIYRLMVPSGSDTSERERM